MHRRTPLLLATSLATVRRPVDLASSILRPGVLETRGLYQLIPPSRETFTVLGGEATTITVGGRA